ncbi:MAG: BrnA antitoxin family protein [Xanthomonadales bacterium]|nr:BrnA antitoxin family protein [Xanthomonadales bacterium]
MLSRNTPMSEDFSKGKRGAVVKADPNKIRITIRLDGDIIEHFKKRVLDAGGGNYQTLLNDALRSLIQSETEPLEDTLRKVIREELKLPK